MFVLFASITAAQFVAALIANSLSLLGNFVFVHSGFFFPHLVGKKVSLFTAQAMVTFMGESITKGVWVNLTSQHDTHHKK